MARSLNDQEITRLAAECSAAGIAVLDREYRIAYCNPAWKAYTEHYSPWMRGETLRNKSWFDIVPESMEQVKPLLDAVLEGETVRRDRLLIDTGGIASYWDIVFSPLVASGEIRGIIINTLDVSEQVQSEQRAEAENEAMPTLANMPDHIDDAEIQTEFAEWRQHVEERTSEIEKRRRVAESLGGVLRVLNSSQPLPDILDYILDQACHIMGADAALLTRIDYESQWVATIARSGIPPELDWVTGYPLNATHVTSSAILRRQPVMLGNTPGTRPQDLPTGPVPDKGLRTWHATMMAEYGGMLMVPLIVRDNIYGSLAFYYRTPTEFDDEDMSLASRFADHTSLAIENARLYEQAREAAASAERNRLARELHDAVTQTLFSTSLIAEVLPMLWERNRPEAEKRLNEIRHLTRGALAEMRTLLLELRPTALIEADFHGLLKQLSEALAGRGLVTIDLDVNVETPPPAEVKIALYRITQEALNNVLKHAHAQHVTISGYSRENDVELAICDDGQGFDFESIPPDHLGLGIMRERADGIRAALSIDSEVGVGTEVHVHWRGGQS